MSSRPALVEPDASGYAVVPLAQVADVFTDGNWIETKDQAESGIRLVQTGNVGCGEYKDRADKARFIDEAAFERLNCFEVLPGDILVSRLPDPVGRACIVPDIGQKMITAVDCSIVRVRKSAVNPSFLAYYTQTHEYLANVDRRCTGTTRRRISRKNLGQVPVPLPPLEEQKRIVAVLDQAFAALDRARVNAEANLADAQELQGNALDAAFRALAQPGWTVSLAAAVHSECKLSYGIVQPGEDADGGLPVVRPIDLKMRIINADSLKRIAPERAASYARTTLVGGELLLCVRGSTGEVCVASDDLAGCNVTRGIVPIRFDSARVLPEFAFFQFRSRFMRDQIAAKTYGAALMQINVKDLRELTFLVPPISTQEKTIARAENFFDGGARLCRNYEAQLADHAALRQSLLQKAFAGELT